MGSYCRLSAGEREEISRGLAQGKTLAALARELKRNKSTLSREIRKGGGTIWSYRAERAHHRAERNARKRKAGYSKISSHWELAVWIQQHLRLKWSPEQIAEALKKEYPNRKEMHVSPETIYTYLYVLPKGALKKELLRGLRQDHRHRHRRQGETPRPLRKLQDMLSIEERPKAVEDRSIPGHWEGDLIVGKYRQSALGTLVERTTRTVILVPLKSKRAEEVAKAFAREMRSLPRQMKLTLTYDQGREMAAHKLFTQSTGMKVYFAHPASPWERGTNENTNGLLRQFFPKGTDFNHLSRKEIKHVQDLMNGRPRKTLLWKTPYEAFHDIINSLH
jgi:IS30 family transposase